jgi:hypothetical protein
MGNERGIMCGWFSIVELDENAHHLFVLLRQSIPRSGLLLDTVLTGAENRAVPIGDRI